MENFDITLPSSAETGELGIMHLKRFWAKGKAKREGMPAPGAWQS